ncbi:MAG: hypothetical protein SGILL_007588 [Bacillariaceae sp.]
MTTFSGTLLGKSFDRVEAENIGTLCSLVLPRCDTDHLTVYIETPFQVPGHKGTYWVNIGRVWHSQVILDHYMKQYGLGADGVPINCIFRYTDAPDPMTDRNYDSIYCSRPELPTQLAERIPPWYSREFARKIVNENEPFTNKPINYMSDLCRLHPLIFDYGEVVLVDMQELIVQAKKRIRDNLDLREMEIEYFATSSDAPERGTYVDFHRPYAVHWARYIFPRSKELQDMYAEAFGESNLVELIREGQLKELGSDCHISGLRCWIADLEDFSQAEERLVRRFETEAAPPLMSPFYFTIQEAEYLGDILVPCETRKTLRESLFELAETHGMREDGFAVNQALACSLASHLKSVFNIESTLHPEIREDLLEYLKERSEQSL